VIIAAVNRGAGLSESARELLGSSNAIVQLRALIPKLARSDAPALITGSTGTGKEHFARMLHRSSPRASGPFLPVNCAAIPDTLFESELFGFERGSFTGASHAQRGKAAMADGGVLFLDEIGELSPLCQTKLLRMLEEREIQPIGAPRPVKIDVRVIAATNRAVEEQVDKGLFRSDLFYRLNVARVVIPDLRERPQDIAFYFDHFIQTLNSQHGTRVTAPSGELMELLLHYRWPGNVREVRNFVEAVFIDPPDGAIEPRDIPAAFALLQTSYARTGDEERARIVAALDKTNWNKAEAAKALHWSRMTLYRKLTKHRVTRGGLTDVT
jgi:two-component system, NtrC family, response regulator AtoC